MNSLIGFKCKITRFAYFRVFQTIVGDFTTYLDGKIYKCILATGGGIAPPNVSNWIAVDSTFDYDKFETSIPVVTNGGSAFNGTATIVLVYPEIENATERWLPPSYRLLVSKAYVPNAPASTLPRIIESQGAEYLTNQLPIIGINPSGAFVS